MRTNFTAAFALLAMFLLTTFAMAAGLEDKQSIAELVKVKLATDQSLLEFLVKLPGAKDTQIFLAIMLGNFIGAFGNYFYRWQAAEGDAGLFDYFKAQGKKKAWWVIGSIVIYSGVEVGSGLFVNSDGVFLGWPLVFISGIKTGFMGASFGTKKKDPSPEVTAQPGTPAVKP